MRNRPALLAIGFLFYLCRFICVNPCVSVAKGLSLHCHQINGLKLARSAVEELRVLRKFQT